MAERKSVPRLVGRSHGTSAGSRARAPSHRGHNPRRGQVPRSYNPARHSRRSSLLHGLSLAPSQPGLFDLHVALHLSPFILVSDLLPTPSAPSTSSQGAPCSPHPGQSTQDASPQERPTRRRPKGHGRALQASIAIGRTAFLRRKHQRTVSFTAPAHRPFALRACSIESRHVHHLLSPNDLP